MFRIEEPVYFYWLLVLPVLFIMYYGLVRIKKRDLAKLGSEKVLSILMPDYSKYRVWIKYFFWLGALFFIFLSLTNPQHGGRKEKVTAKSSDIIVALDISNSMLAEDIAPSRLERAKRFTSKLIRQLRGERIGLILFAGQAYLQMPLTADYAASELFVASAHPDLAGTQGTSFADAIRLAIQSFDIQSDHQKAMIIISDGEDHEENALKAVDEANNANIVIYTVAVGTEEGSYVPVMVRGRKELKTTETGEPVMSKVNLAFIEEIARKSGGGAYNIVEENAAIQDLKNRIDLLAKRELEQESFTDFNSYYQYLLLIGVFLLFIEVLIFERKTLKNTEYV